MLVDSHCHLDLMAERGTDPAEAVGRAVAAGVARMVTIGTRLAQASAVKALAERFPEVWGTVGVHPQNVGEHPPVAVDALAVLADHPRIVGLGESGLDYHYDSAPPERQRESFRRHVRAAQATGLPLVVHARDADADVAAILQDEHEAGGPFGFVLHCFSSGPDLARAAVAIGGYVSFSGILTFPRSGALRALAADLPADRLLVETDAPYLAPVPLRGRPNEPAYTVHTASALAGARALEPEALAALTTANFARLFPRAA